MRKYKALFYEKPKRNYTGCLVYPLLIILMLTVTFALNYINSGRVALKKQDVTIASLSSDLEKYRILHISDLHGKEFGPDQATIANMLVGSSYKAVCITGDVCASDGNYDAFIKLIKLFPAEIPVFFISGDEDPDPILTAAHATDAVKADYVLAAEAAGAIYLDAPYPITVGKSTIWFCPESVYGLDLVSSRSAYQARRDQLAGSPDAYHPDIAAQIRAIDYRLSVLDKTEAAFREMKPADVQIALAHHPLTDETLNLLQQWAGSEGNFLRSVSLLLAGHNNAGQIRLPMIGALKAPTSAGGAWFPEDHTMVGLSIVHGITQYISPGLGVSDDYSIPLRIFNTPAITILTLTSRLTM